jgi:glucose-1-phosphate adenylyltransferase
MDLISVHPVFNLYNRSWPILTWHEPLPRPSSCSRRRRTAPGTRSTRWSRPGWWCRGARCGARSCRPGPDPQPRPGRGVGADARRRRRPGRGGPQRHRRQERAIPEGAQIGVDLDRDRERFVVSDGGVVVIGKGQKIDA